jgi:carbamoyl-phosphate synthase large subunit
MNVLLTCAGRRSYLVRFFREALQGRGHVCAADCDPSAPALREADRAFIVGRVDQSTYCDQLVGLCQQHNVRLLIPLNDLELPIVAAQRARFVAVGTIPVVSSPAVVNVCFDKWATARFMKSCGLMVPHTYLSLGEARAALSKGQIDFPLVVKPRWGTASIGLEYPEDDQELEWAYSLVRKKLPRTILADVSTHDVERSVLIQERLGGQEYGLDVVNDLDGRYVTTLARQKVAMRAGETDRAITVRSEQLQELGATIGQRLCHFGNLDCDVFMSGGRWCVLEMNPRFGGGYPFSHLAGANLPAVLIAWANGREPDARWLKVEPNVMASKADGIVVIAHEASRDQRALQASR